MKIPNLRILAYDTEMISTYGMPNPDIHPIAIISVAYFENNKLEYKLFVITDEELENGNDKRIILDFINFIHSYNPDLLLSYNGDQFDWTYLEDRAKKHGLTLNIGRDNSSIRIKSGHAGFNSVDIIGRLNVDLYKLAVRELDEVKVKKLENVAEYLGVCKREDRTILVGKEIAKCWNEDRKRVYAYARDDVVSTLEIGMKMLPGQIFLSNLIGCPLDDQVSWRRGRQVEHYLTYKAYSENELIPFRKGDEGTYEGAFVLKPEKGLINSIAVLDFASMYPNIMIKFNISPDTIAKSPFNNEDVYITPEVGHAFKKSPDGFFKNILITLLSERANLRTKMNTYERGTSDYNLLDIQQYNLKILINSFYGFTAYAGSKLFKKECAESVTAWGRYYIKKAMEICEREGFEVLYSDTDSCMVSYKDIKDLLSLKSKVEELVNILQKELEFEIKIDALYKSILFTGVKKRYIALNEFDERIDRGFEVRRGDWSTVAREVQSAVLDIILREENPEKAIKYVRNIILDLKNSKIPLDKLVIYKTLTKPIGDYDNLQAHVVAAERALASPAQIRYSVNSKIPYVIFYGHGKLSNRAFPYEVIDEFKNNEFISDGAKFKIDVEYYIKKQIKASALRILEIFGYEEDDLGVTIQKKLDI